MVAVTCLILCSKFAKNRLSARPAVGACSAHPDPLAGSWGKGGKRKGGKAGKEGKGRTKKGKKSGGEERGKGGVSPE